MYWVGSIDVLVAGSLYVTLLISCLLLNSNNVKLNWEYANLQCVGYGVATCVGWGYIDIKLLYLGVTLWLD